MSPTSRWELQAAPALQSLLAGAGSVWLPAKFWQGFIPSASGEHPQADGEGRQAGRDSGDGNLWRSCESPLVYAGREVAEPKDTLKPPLGVFLPRWGSLHRISPSSRGYTRSFVNRSDSPATAPQGGGFGTSSTQLSGWQTRKCEITFSDLKSLCESRENLLKWLPQIRLLSPHTAAGFGGLISRHPLSAQQLLES